MDPSRVQHNEFYADILPDRRDSGLWFYVVQRKHSPEVLAMGSALSEESARQIASSTMRSLSPNAVADAA